MTLPPPASVPLTTIALLVASNVFMTLAWYGHLKFKESALWLVILICWGIAFFEYCLHVPANRLGHTVFSAAELKTLQETPCWYLWCFRCSTCTNRCAGITLLALALSGWARFLFLSLGRRSAEGIRHLGKAVNV